ncbi:hypothetical protein FQZ97_1230730 [compost metagenome]
MQLLNDFLQRLQAGDVHERHPLQANHQQARVGVSLRQDALEGFRRTKEQRPFDRIHQHPGR